MIVQFFFAYIALMLNNNVLFRNGNSLDSEFQYPIKAKSRVPVVYVRLSSILSPA